MAHSKYLMLAMVKALKICKLISSVFKKCNKGEKDKEASSIKLGTNEKHGASV